MRILLTVGHSVLKTGSTTSADGTKYGGGNEYKYNKYMSVYLKEELEKLGHEVDRVVCPERLFTKCTEEKKYKLSIEKSTKYDLCIELHLNAAMPSAEGCEVLYKSAAGKKYAEKVQKQLSKVFKSRGIQKRDNLYMLNATRCPCIIIETFFCTNKAEWNFAVKNKKKIAKLIATGIGK